MTRVQSMASLPGGSRRGERVFPRWAWRLARAWLCLGSIIAAGMPSARAAEPAAFAGWAKHARLGGVAAWVGMEPAEMSSALDARVAEKVTVIEADSDLSNYLTDAEFAEELALMRQFAAAAHARGLKVVWYYPSLEVLTPNGVNLAHTMYKDHPDWVQLGLDGTPNVFYGGTGQVFWVDPDTESAWMSPSSPYRDYFIARVKQIVATGVDGIWLDVPLYADFGPTQWTDRNPYAMAQFQSVTGFTAPTAVDWNSAAWRRWVAWRHEELAAFLTDVVTAVRSVNPEFPVIVETLPTDYNGATIYGLDGAYLKHVEGVTHVWEVDIMSNATGMRKAREDDWISFISAYKYTRAASGKKPSWVFSYGRQVDDAELVMAQALAGGNNPYELKVPQMTTTVGAAFRTKMFGWIEENERQLFDAQPGARVAVLYSSASRDYVDKFAGLGMFVTWQSNDSLWWAGAQSDSAYQRQYLAEFRGMVKLLVHNHVPFDVVVNPGAGDLEAYDAVILPDVEAISDPEADRIRQFVGGGGHLIVTGPNPTGFDAFGNARADYALADLLDFHKGAAQPAETARSYGAGTVRSFSALLGKAYFVQTDAAAADKLKAAVAQASALPLTTTADRRVYFELRRSDAELALQFVNFIGVTGTFAVVPTTFSVALGLPSGMRATRVALTTPDDAVAGPVPVSFVDGGGAVTFEVPLTSYGMAIVSLEQIGGGGGNPPVVRTPIPDVSLVAGSSVLLHEVASSFYDPDGDALTFAAALAGGAPLPSWLAFRGSVFSGTPPLGAAGAFEIEVTATDPSGGTARDTFSLTVTPAVPQVVTETYVSLAAEDGWVKESGETTNAGGSLAAGGTGDRALRIGDDAGDRQYRSILSFDTSAIPEGVVLTSARLQLTRGGTDGTSPLTTHGPCTVDVRRGSFGTSSALQTGDFQAPADAVGSGQIAASGGAGTLQEIALDAGGVGSVNTAGRTQLRISCARDDDDDLTADVAGFYSGEATATRRPKLVVTYAR